MKYDEMKRHRPDIIVVGEGKALAYMPEDPMGVWCHIQDVNDLIAKKDEEIESLKASHYAEMVDAGMRERKLKRALYKACAMWADRTRLICSVFGSNAPKIRWERMLDKCRAKAEQYK